MNRLSPLTLVLLGLCLLATGLARAGDAPAPPAEYFTHLQMGRAHLDASNPRRAFFELGMAVQAYSNDADAWTELAKAARGTGDDDGGLAFSARAAELGAKAAPAATEAAGPPARLILRYLAHAPYDGGRREPSVDAGQPLLAGCLCLLAVDAKGIPVAVKATWEVSEGLTIGAPEDPATIKAGDKPCKSQVTAKVATAGEPLSTSVQLLVIGPLATLKVEPEKADAHAGERVHMRLSAADAAGHRLWYPEFAWTVEAMGASAMGAIRRAKSEVAVQNGSEAHRNIFDVAKENLPADGTQAKVIVSDLAGKIRCEGLLTLAAGPAANTRPATGIPWIYSYEEGMAAAKEEDKPAMVEIMADW